MFYVYILRSKRDQNFYVGYTNNLRRRLSDHNNKQNRSTTYRLPLELIYYEAFRNKFDALRRERYLKSSKGHTTLKTMLKEYLAEVALI